MKNAADGEEAPGCQVKVILDGPYGGLTLDVDNFGVMLLIAGGSGVTFMLGCIEECMRKGVNGGGPRRIECAWVVKDMGKWTANVSRDSASHLTTRMKLHRNHRKLSPHSCLPS